VIADSPYDLQGLVVRPRLGFVAGVIAALLMLPVIFFLQPLSKLALADVLENLGVVLLSGDAPATHLIIAGTLLHALLGGLFGVLYALCQTRADKKGLIGVGISYGVALWLLSSLFTIWAYRDTLHYIFHSWSWLVASLVYGFCLAQVALWVERHRPKQDQVVPVD
jgi:hypothetical protein